MTSPDPKLADTVLDALSYPDDPRWPTQNAAQQQLVCMSIVEGQVFNGGFHQVYFNDCHQYLPLALEGYRAIGAKDHARIVERVMAMVAEDPMTGPPEIWPDPDAPDRPESALNIGNFDDPWYALDAVRLRWLKSWYIERYPDKFPQP